MADQLVKGVDDLLDRLLPNLRFLIVGTTAWSDPRESSVQPGNAKSATLPASPNTGLPGAPAKWATEVSTVRTRSSVFDQRRRDRRSWSIACPVHEVKPAGGVPGLDRMRSFCRLTNVIRSPCGQRANVSRDIDRLRSLGLIGRPAQTSARSSAAPPKRTPWSPVVYQRRVGMKVGKFAGMFVQGRVQEQSAG